MGIRINQNLFSLLVNRNLERVTQRLQTSYERLSSGERITRAGDDAAGLAISHGIRHGIRGMQQNIRNANEALSVSATAESALSEITNVLQRLREISIQACSSLLTADNRAAIQVEIDSMVEEIDRVADTTDFNGRLLLNGSDSSTKVQIGTQGTQFISVSLPDARSAVLGCRAQATGASTAGSSPIAGTGDLLINGITVGASEDDGLSSALPNASAVSKARAINALSDQTGVEARAEPAVFAIPGAAISAISLDGTATSLSINGYNIGAVTVTAGDANDTLIQAINSRGSLTGVEATVSPGGHLVLTAEDGRNIEITTTGSVADDLGLAAADSDLSGVVQTARITLTSGDTINVGGDLALLGFDAGQAVTNIDLSTSVNSISVGDTESAQQALMTLDQAIAQVLSHRANLGAIQNRLESGVRSLGLQIEELSSTNQRILDTDFAQESARLAQLEILQEAGIAILAQANSLPRTTLSLLMK